MEKNTYKYFLVDLIHLLKEYAQNAKSSNKADDYDKGKSMAYYEVLSLIQSQASAFQIPFDSIGLEGLVPEDYL